MHKDQKNIKCVRFVRVMIRITIANNGYTKCKDLVESPFRKKHKIKYK